jgi:hypothetical protein
MSPEPKGMTRISPGQLPQSFGTATVTRRQVIRLLGAATVIGLPATRSGLARASDLATPDAVGERLSAYPELSLTSTDTELKLPAEITAGRYVVTIDNQSTQGESAPVFVLLEDGQTVEELLADPGDPSTGLPEWFLTGTIVGAPIAPLSMTAKAVIDFPVGNYAVSGEPYQPVKALTVTTGKLDSSPEPDADATITMSDDGWTGMPEIVSTGQQLWKVTSAGSVPHRFQFYSYPEPVTTEALIAALSLEEGATLPPDLPDLSLAVPLGGLSPMSAGNTGWPVIELASGFYIALCTIQNGEAAVPHYLSGELTVFTVVEDATG